MFIPLNSGLSKHFVDSLVSVQLEDLAKVLGIVVEADTDETALREKCTDRLHNAASLSLVVRSISISF